MEEENDSLRSQVINLENEINKLSDQITNRISKRKGYTHILEEALDTIVDYVKNVNTINIDTFYEDLYKKIESDSCSYSYKDYKYYNLLPINDLYVAFTKENLDKLISDFNAKYDNKCNIVKFSNIKHYSMRVISSPRGTTSSGFYSLEFTVHYKKIE